MWTGLGAAELVLRSTLVHLNLSNGLVFSLACGVRAVVVKRLATSYEF